MASQISANSQTVAAAIEEQTAGMHEINANAESLAQLASELNDLVRKFKV